MLTHIDFGSLAMAKALAPNGAVAVISVLDVQEREQRPSFLGFHSVLELCFEDAYEGPGQIWPDEPTAEQHSQLATYEFDEVPALSHAHAIVGHIQALHRLPEQLGLFVHCHAGQSRSAAIAEWVATRFWVPLNTSRSLDRANPRLARLLSLASTG